MGKRQGGVRTETSRERQRNRLTEKDLLSDMFEKARLRHTVYVWGGDGGAGGVCVCVEGVAVVLVPRQLCSSWVRVRGMAFLDLLFFKVLIGSKVYLAPCSLLI